MGVPPLVGTTSAAWPSRHAHLERTRTPCELTLSVTVLSGCSRSGRATGASFTSIIIGSLRSSLPVRWWSEFILNAPLVKKLSSPARITLEHVVLRPGRAVDLRSQTAGFPAGLISCLLLLFFLRTFRAVTQGRCHPPEKQSSEYPRVRFGDKVGIFTNRRYPAPRASACRSGNTLRPAEQR